MSSRPPLIGTYAPPAVRIGQRVECLFRDRVCVVTSVTDAPVPWPRVQPTEQRGSGLWVCAELVKAIRTESAAAIKHHFGVSAGVVWRWRTAFGVGGRAGTPGSKRAIRAAARLGAAAVKAKEWSDDELDAKAARSKALGLRPGPRWTPERGGWTAEQLATLGTDHDEVVSPRSSAARGPRSRHSA